MNGTDAPHIERLTDKLLDEVVRIHIAGLPYTLNSRMGTEHMTFLYRSMADDPTCYVGVAMRDGVPMGVVSGSVDAAKFTSKLLRSMEIARLARIGTRLLLHPAWLVLWWQGRRIAAPMVVNAMDVKAVLTAIAVEPKAHGMGIGRALVAAFEGFLRGAGVDIYRLDTLATNAAAEAFYRRLGFEEVARRTDSIIFVRKMMS